MLSERLPLVARLTAAFGQEIAALDPATAVPWPELPDAAALLRHVGGVHRWVVQVLESGAAVPQAPMPSPDGDPLAWYAEGRRLLLDALDGPQNRPCWTLAGPGTAGAWTRRMVFENAKHLMDVRAAATGGAWPALPELTAEDCADGVDELFEVFLPRARRRLAPLPGPVELVASDATAHWRLGADWRPDPTGGDGAARITGSAAALALALWERADLGSAGLRVEGDPAAARALLAATITPW